ncbi:MAG TPA: cytochrome b N-terminal domain-containing protein [Nitrososphaeraceae archaeon]
MNSWLEKIDNNTKNNGFLQSRLGWNKIFSHPIPKHANNATYTLGGMLLVLGIVQGITGVILQQFYHPHPVSPGAYEALIQIVSRFDLSFVRNIHYWGAQFMIIITLLHMMRVFITGSYKKPREMQWLAGVGLLALSFAFTFTGTVLKWDQEAIEALGHQVELGNTIGAIGSFFTTQFAPSVPLLTRLYASHVTVIPILTLPVLALHLALIRLLGLSSPKILKQHEQQLRYLNTDHHSGSEPEQAKVLFSSHIKRMFVYGIAVTIIVIILSVILPAPLSMKGVEGIEITKPPWYLLWMFPLEDLFGLGVIPYASAIIIIGLAAVPLIDRKEVTEPAKRKAMIIGMLVLIAIFVGLMIAGAVTPVGEHL